MKTLLFGLLMAVAGAACGGDDTETPKDAPLAIDAPNLTPDAPSDAAPGDGGVTDASCFDNPQTNDEIINACTTAQKIYKDSHPAGTLPDGGLPPLPP